MTYITVENALKALKRVETRLGYKPAYIKTDWVKKGYVLERFIPKGKVTA